MELERAEAPAESDDYKVADSGALRRMLRSTRDEEFRLAIEVVRNHVRQGRWLDIGCSYGWFLQLIRLAEYEPFGVEPSPTACSEAKATFGAHVANGEFPTVLIESGLPGSFQVLSTMDVLEHIQLPEHFLHAARDLCATEGVLLVKVPSNEGLLFQLFSALASTKRHAGLSRLWQVEFNYPHWHYYSPQSIRCMLERHGFEVLEERRLPFAFLSTATDRVRSYENANENHLVLVAKALGAYVLVAASYVLRRFDNIVVLARPSRPRDSAP